MITSCPYCTVGTAGNHESGCPNEHSPRWIEPSSANPLPQGWICPNCGRVYAPWTDVCFACAEVAGRGTVANTDGIIRGEKEED
jgi:hypothetical protein